MAKKKGGPTLKQLRKRAAKINKKNHIPIYRHKGKNVKKQHLLMRIKHARGAKKKGPGEVSFKKGALSG